KCDCHRRLGLHGKTVGRAEWTRTPHAQRARRLSLRRCLLTRRQAAGFVRRRSDSAHLGYGDRPGTTQTKRPYEACLGAGIFARRADAGERKRGSDGATVAGGQRGRSAGANQMKEKLASISIIPPP